MNKELLKEFKIDELYYLYLYVDGTYRFSTNIRHDQYNYSYWKIEGNSMYYKHHNTDWHYWKAMDKYTNIVKDCLVDRILLEE